MNDDLLQKQTICFYVNGRWEPIKEIVRCKDCKFRDTNGCRSEHSHVEWDGLIDEFYPDDDWYCADGERR